jgi:hydroxymethylpyrimidine/phosphomethylpyrimidine kinase
VSATTRLTPPVALSIAGTDSGGGAGIAADLHAFAANGAFGTFVVTAVTAQNTTAVDAVAAIAPGIVRAQLESVLEDLPPLAVKTGMLANGPIVELVADYATSGRLASLVVDPVMAAASGGRLLDANGRGAYGQLIAGCRLVTPNALEAEELTGVAVRDLNSAYDAARLLQEMGAEAVLLKGGHLQGAAATDLLLDGDECYELVAPRLASTNIHGTGCTLSAAIAAHLARGSTLLEAVRLAKSYVHAAIAAGASWHLGRGPGPLDHRLGQPGPSVTAGLVEVELRTIR